MHLPFFQRRGGKLGNPASPNSNVHANHAAILLATQFLIQLVGSGTQDFAFLTSSLVGHMGFSVLSQGWDVGTDGGSWLIRLGLTVVFPQPE